jgi:hypothetical protein
MCCSKARRKSKQEKIFA